MRLPTAACLFLLVASSAFAQTAPQNLDFESGPIGQPPPGWKLVVQPASAHATLLTSADDPQAGHASAKLTLDDADAGAALRQDFDAAPYRGMLVLLRVAIRLQSKKLGYASLNIDMNDAKGELLDQRSFDEFVYDGPWQIREETFFVPQQAAKMSIRAFLHGAGSLGLDSVSLSAVTPEQMHYEGPRPLTARGVANLEAFARLYGYVRFFYPSDQAMNADWFNVAISAVPKVERAQNASELVQALRDVFQPEAPTLRIYETGTPPPPEPADLKSQAGVEFLGWKNRGVSLGPRSNVYSSERVTLTAPEAPFEADLPGGVSIIMPLSLYRDKVGTLPHAIAQPSGGEPQFVPSGLDRSTRLADIAMLWSVYQNFFPNFDYTPVNWSDQLATSLKQAATDATPDQFDVTLQKMIAPVNDGHGWVSLDNHVRRSLPVRWEYVDGQLVIRVAATSTGLHPGDIVEKYNGRPVNEVIAHDIDPIVSASTPQGRESVEVYWLKMNDGSPVTLDVKTASGLIVRKTLQPVPSYFEPFPGQPEQISEVKPGIWYVDLDGLTSEYFAAKLPDLAKAKAVIFDMRLYPTEAAIEVLRHLTDKPIHSPQFNMPVYLKPDRKDVTYETDGWWTLQPAAPRLPGKIIFLTGNVAISFAESVMGTVSYNHLATIVGSDTAGTNGNVNPVFLPGGYIVDFTGMRVLNQDGSRFFGIGIKPDVPVEPTIASIRAGHDEVLDKAVAIASQAQ